MNRLAKRLDTLEASKCAGLVIFIADKFDGDDPVIRKAWFDGEIHERGAEEPQDAFLRRINVKARNSATLEADCEDL